MRPRGSLPVDPQIAAPPGTSGNDRARMGGGAVGSSGAGVKRILLGVVVESPSPTATGTVVDSDFVGAGLAGPEQAAMRSGTRPSVRRYTVGPRMYGRV